MDLTMGTYEARVLSCRAVDGDTIRCTVDLGWRINAQVVLRLLGVDTPERRNTSLICAQFVTTQVERWISHVMMSRTSQLWIQSESIDMYGRTLGDLYVLNRDNMSMNLLTEWLVRYGYAMRTTSGRRHDWTEQELTKALLTDSVLPNLA